MRTVVGSRRPQIETVLENEEIVRGESVPALAAEKIYVAVGKDLHESASALKWALKNLQAAPIVLLHVYVPPLFIPSGTGNMPVNQVRREAKEAYEKNEKRDTDNCMNKYLQVCNRAKVKADTLIVSKLDVSKGIVEEVWKRGITKLVMGTTSTRGVRLKIQGPGKADYIRKHAINSCDVLIVCKDKLVSEGKGCAVENEDFSRSFSLEPNLQRCLSRSSETSPNFPLAGDSPAASTEDVNDVQSESQLSPEESTEIEILKFQLMEALEVAENAKRELQRETIQRMKAQAAAMKTNRKLKDYEGALEEAMEEKESAILESKLKEDKWRSLVNQFSNERDEAFHELEVAREKFAAMEKQNHAFCKKRRLKLSNFKTPCVLGLSMETPSSSNTLQIREYSFDEIKAATCNFSDSLNLGVGGYGNLFRGKIGQTRVAVKTLRKDSLQCWQEFQREVNILRGIQHPNLVTILGNCFERGCIIYEQMPHGCLADRVSCETGAPPLSWQDRTRIAMEVCSSVQFLHSSKPYPIVHRHLKPENILLDENDVSKTSNFGLARPLSEVVQGEPEPRRTFLYMDPEYMSSGKYTTKSDVYRVGVIILQLLTGKSALGLVNEVESALDIGELKQILDSSAGEWPYAHATQVAELALLCTEPVREKRPDLEPTVMKMLEKLHNIAIAEIDADRPRTAEVTDVPSCFFCPILKEIMQDPCVAADGFTYEREAMEEWFYQGHDTSPMTNVKLEHMSLISNHSLRSAILQWQERHVDSEEEDDNEENIAEDNFYVIPRWPSTTSSKFPCLDLAISPPRQEEGEIGKDPKDGWSVPDPTPGPANVWGKKDDLDPPPSAATALAAWGSFLMNSLFFCFRPQTE
ncbi:U-box domain-containing protein 33 [Cryptomeria japonica]|uniref:U-box domain-containing protein 33 n=1 Tax=Cryptomeria japonica TaxID=3369 RepID=UPI0027D9F6EA|nr:U-box domain-containing protein 33 [Cryptomeria japonica]